MRYCPIAHKLVILISLCGVFEFYDLFFTGYVAPGMVQSGLFKPESLGFFAALQPLAVAGFGTFVFATVAGLWVGTLVLGYVADRFRRRLVFTWSLIWYMVCTHGVPDLRIRARYLAFHRGHWHWHWRRARHNRHVYL